MPQEQPKLIGTKAISISPLFISLIFCLSPSFPSSALPQHCHPHPKTGFQGASGPCAEKQNFRQPQSLKSYCLGIQKDTGFIFLAAVCMFLRKHFDWLSLVRGLDQLTGSKDGWKSDCLTWPYRHNCMDFGMSRIEEERFWKSRMAFVHYSSLFAQHKHIVSVYVWFQKCPHLYNPTIPLYMPIN